MRAALGEEGGFPIMDVVLLGVDEKGNVGSFFPEHEIMEGRIRNYEKTWGATGEYRYVSLSPSVLTLS